MPPHENPCYSSMLAAGADEKAQQCGRLKDRFGVSWQVVPRVLPELLTHPDPAVAQRTMAALMKMKEIRLRCVAACRQRSLTQGARP